MKSHNNQNLALAWVFIIGGLIAFAFSFLITLDKLVILQDPNYQPPCSINPLVSCGTIIKSEQASVFGFPNPLIGISGFSIITTIGFAMLAGARFRKWFWISALTGLTFATGFIYWLFYQSLYVIGALCLYCMAVWITTLPMTTLTLKHCVKENYLNLGSKRIHSIFQKYHFFLLLILYAIIFVPIANRLIQYWLIYT